MSTDSKIAEALRKLAACQRVMDLIDAYVERPNAGNRLSIREGLWELAAHSPKAASGTSEQAGEAVARPLEPLTERERELLDGLTQYWLDHAKQCDGIANRRMAERQKGWDMERVALLRKLGGITKEPKT